MIRRAAMTDVADVNRWIERDNGEPADLTEVMSNPLNVVLLAGEGGAIFMWRGPGIYEVHVFFEQRGREVLDISRSMLALMRLHGAKMFWSAVPVESRHVIMFTRLMGWKSHGTAQFPHGHCEIFVGE